MPSSDDFISIFGCEYSVSDDLIQKYKFQDDAANELGLTLGLSDCSFGLSLLQNGFEILKIYDERLRSVTINESDQSILAILGDTGKEQKIRIVVWPKAQISIEYLAK